MLTRERSYRRQPEKLQPVIDARYGKKYPAFCDTMRHRADTYNAAREELFQLEREGRALLFAPESTEGFSRVEKDVGKLKALYEEGRRTAEEQLPAMLEYLNK